VAVHSSQKLPVLAAYAHSSADAAATSRPNWKARLRPKRACVWATGPVNSALPTT
jgi:hypothetical protein